MVIKSGARCNCKEYDIYNVQREAFLFLLMRGVFFEICAKGIIRGKLQWEESQRVTW